MFAFPLFSRCLWFRGMHKPYQWQQVTLKINCICQSMNCCHICIFNHLHYGACCFVAVDHRSYLSNPSCHCHPLYLLVEEQVRWQITLHNKLKLFVVHVVLHAWIILIGCLFVLWSEVRGWSTKQIRYTASTFSVKWAQKMHISFEFIGNIY